MQQIETKNEQGLASLQARARPLLPPKEQLHEFVTALFEPDHLVQVTAIEKWTDSDGHNQKQHIHSNFLRQKELLTDEKFEALRHVNRTMGGNIFAGLAPRAKRRGGKDAIATVVTVFCDFDRCSVDEACKRLDDIGLPPSVVVASGNGVHAYHLLREPYDVRTLGAANYEWMLRALYADLGQSIDTTVVGINQLMRLVGFENVKGWRMGVPPTRCELIECDPGRRYPLRAFRHWFNRGIQEQRNQQRESQCKPVVAADIPDEARQLVLDLGRDVADKSKRDFRIVCDMVRMGLTDGQIRELVANTSKFRIRAKRPGDRYLELTIRKARRAVGR